MRNIAVASLFLAFALSAGAQASKPDAQIRLLRKSYPNVEWDAKSAKLADIDCDGRPDTVVLGSRENTVAVGVVWGQRKKKPQVLFFPVEPHLQNGFCVAPKKIEVSPLNCDTSDEKGGPLPGCTQKKGCQQFSVLNDDCDDFNFYWNASTHTLSWWRL